MNRSFQPEDIRIAQGFWGNILQMNAEIAIFHQWDQLESTGSIENFRIVTGESPHFRTPLFFSDSDVYKWLEAACRITLHHPSDTLTEKIDALSDLIRQAQEPDGYIFTYNQILFPGQRWVALPLEHELYCHGHLIEACLTHNKAFTNGEMLSVATRAADLICDYFFDKPPRFQPGHQEIELALIALYESTGVDRYLQMAERFLERRGRVRGWSYNMLSSGLQSIRRSNEVKRSRKAFERTHPEVTPFIQPPNNPIHSTPWLVLRFLASATSGKYFQTHLPIAKQKKAVGHSVRFGYMMAAQTHLARLKPTEAKLDGLEVLWKSMVNRRMYVTGGLGSLPLLEGFGRDDELDPSLAYAETCAAIAGLLWDWELLLETEKPEYAELMEWQLYNAILVGIGLDGRSYLYNNPMSSDGEFTRESWFACSCCPSNISRIFATLGRYLFTYTEDTFTLQQYISAETDFNTPAPLHLRVRSNLPMELSAEIILLQVDKPNAQLKLRIPGWSEGVSIAINGRSIAVQLDPLSSLPASGGYSPYDGQYLTLPGTFREGDRITVGFHPTIKSRRVSPRVNLGTQDTAISYGPLVFCAESVDNPGIDLASITLDLKSFKPGLDESSPGGIVLEGLDCESRSIRMIPYFAWANRGPSQMRVFFSVK